MSVRDLNIYAALEEINPGGMNFRGNWDAATVYRLGDVTVVGADSYVCKEDTGSLNEPPATTPAVWLNLTGVVAGAQVLSLNTMTNELSLSGGGGMVDVGTISAIQALNLKTAEMSHLLGTDETTFGPPLPVVSATQGVNIHGKLEVTMGPAQISSFTNGQLDMVGCAIASNADITTTADMACNELSYVTLNPPIVIPPATAPGGVNTSVQYNNGGAFAGDNKLTYVAGTETLNATHITGEDAVLSTATSNISLGVTDNTVKIGNTGVAAVPTLTFNNNAGNLSTITESATGDIEVNPAGAAITRIMTGDLEIVTDNIEMSGVLPHITGVYHLRGKNNTDITIQGKGTGDVVISTQTGAADVDAIRVADTTQNITMTTPALTINTLPAASTSNVMYYDNGTGAVSYGAAPSGGTLVDISSAPFLNLPVSDTVWVDAATEKMYSYQTPYLDVPVARTLPTFGGAVVNVATEAALDAALAAAVAGQTIRLTADILAVATTKNINAGIRLTSDTGTRVLSCAAQTTTVSVNTPAATNVLIDNIILENSNTSSVATVVNVVAALNDSTYFNAATIRTNEFGIVNNGARIQVTNCTFQFVGTPDSHRYIGLYRNTGQTIIANNTFAGNGTLNTACIFMTGVAAPFIGGSLVVLNNSSVTAPVQRLMIAENPFTGTNFNFWFVGNTLQTNSGFVIIYNATSLDGIASITAYGNTETAAPGSAGGKGLIGLDSAAAFTIPGPTAAPVCYFANNSMVSTLAPNWVDWTYEQDDGIAYNSALATATGTKKYSPGWSAAPISKDITYNTTTNTMTVPNVYIPGKLTVDGLIDPTGMIFTPQATNPGAGLATLYVDSATNALRYDFGGLRTNGPVTMPSLTAASTANSVYYNVATGALSYGAAPGGGFTTQLARYSMTGSQGLNTAVNTEGGRTYQQLQFDTLNYNNITGLTYINGGTWRNDSGSPMTILANACVWIQFGNTPGNYGYETIMNIGGQQASDSQWFPVPSFASTEAINNINRITFSITGIGIVPAAGTITLSARSTLFNNGAGSLLLNQNGATQMNLIRLA